LHKALLHKKGAQKMLMKLNLIGQSLDSMIAIHVLILVVLRQVRSTVLRTLLYEKKKLFGTN